MRRFVICLVAIFSFFVAGFSIAAEPDADELAKKLANPVAPLISVPFQNNWDFGNGELKRTSYLLNFQPVIPFALNKEWNLITRTIVPFYVQPAMATGMDKNTGLGDIQATFFMSPTPKSPSSIIWGAGPIFLIPSATENALGNGKWGAGPSVVFLRQTGPWTAGALLNHIWAATGKSNGENVNRTFIEPFVAYGITGGYTITLDSETLVNWAAQSKDRWTVPLNLTFSKVTKIYGQSMSFAVGARYYTQQPTMGPNWGARAVVTFIFPEK